MVGAKRNKGGLENCGCGQARRIECIASTRDSPACLIFSLTDRFCEPALKAVTGVAGRLALRLNRCRLRGG